MAVSFLSKSLLPPVEEPHTNTLKLKKVEGIRFYGLNRTNWEIQQSSKIKGLPFTKNRTYAVLKRKIQILRVSQQAFVEFIRVCALLTMTKVSLPAGQLLLFAIKVH